MSIQTKSIVQSTRRIRRTPEEARSLALASARRLLLQHGPDAITLQAVAADLGMSHTNLLHHFGSAGGLHSSLMREMVSELTTAIESAVVRFRSGEGNVRDFVDIVFDAFDSGGAGQLAAWIMLSGEAQHLVPVREVVRKYMHNVEAGDEDSQTAHARISAATLLVTTAAFGDALIGDQLREMVGRERSAMRSITAGMLTHIVNPSK
jgi:AcrR family transcriptional regulator